MGFIAFAVVVAIICLGIAAFVGFSSESSGAGIAALILAGIVGAVVIGGGWAIASYTSIASGEEGVLKNQNGVYVGVLGSGAHWISPLDSVETANIATQKSTFNRIQAVSRESQDVRFDVQVNYHLNPKNLLTLYRNTHGDWFDIYVSPAVQQDVKEQTTRYYTIDLAKNRAVLSSNIEKALTTDLAAHSIIVDGVFVTNLGYSQQFVKAIESKQVASQHAARAEQVVKQRVAEADQARAVARGERDASVIRAEGQAHANRLLSASLTPKVIQYELVQKLAPGIQSIVPSQGIFNLGNVGTGK